MAKPQTHYLIDGYNVIHAWPELKQKTRELSEARDALVAIMSEYGAYENYLVTVVFDAAFTEDVEHEEKLSSRLTVVYTGAGETADSRIERRAYNLTHEGHEVFVVTSDGAEQAAILGAGAYRIPVRELHARVNNVKKILRSRYLGKVTLPYVRPDVADRLDSETIAKLNQLRHE